MRHILLALVFVGTLAQADSYMAAAPLANVALADPNKEAAAKDLMNEVRCVVCQGQSIADSNADLAGDMRAMIRERIERGETPETIRSWLIQRYGKWVSYDPPLSAMTAPLWALPLLLLGIGGWLVAGRLRIRKRAP